MHPEVTKDALTERTAVELWPDLQIGDAAMRRTPLFIPVVRLETAK
jgi:hypothetical protein